MFSFLETLFFVTLIFIHMEKMYILQSNLNKGVNNKTE